MSPTAMLYVLDTPAVVCIAFAAFVIGAMLTGALWFIYSKTGRSLLPMACRGPWSTTTRGWSAITSPTLWALFT